MPPIHSKILHPDRGAAGEIVGQRRLRREPPRLNEPDQATNVPPALPHPNTCTPRRPSRWVRKSPRRDASPARSEREGWRRPSLRTGPGGAPMRINMTYHNSFVTSADFSPTVGRDVYAEGPFEGIYRSKLSTDCDTAEFQFQIGTISWETRDGETRSYTLDGGRITSEGREVWFEIKAHQSYFVDPGISDLLAAAESALAEHDIELERIDGSTLLDPLRIQSVSEVLRFRNAPFDELRDVEKAIAVINAHGGSAPLAAVLEALHASRRQARAMACAMLVRRAIGFRADAPLTPDTPVHIPRRPNRRLTRIES